MSRQDHERVIRAIDPERLIFVDGLTWGNEPCPELIDLGVVQSTRAYRPSHVTHYQTSWVGDPSWPEPTWPGQMADGEFWDRERLAQHYAPWIALAEQGVGVHCGEGGTYNRTPHAATLAYLHDALDILSGAGIGFALWNLRGSFGILDSGRADVDYEDWHGHKLDRKLLDLLRAF